MSNIITLPTAASKPVVQQLRPGGRPKKIASLARARLNRANRARRHAESQDSSFTYPPGHGHMSIFTLPGGRWEFSAIGKYQADPALASAVLHAAAAELDRRCGIADNTRHATVTLIANHRQVVSFPREAQQS